MSRDNILLLALGLLLLAGFPSADSHGSITAGVLIDPICELRPGTAHHASETWDRESSCAHCRKPLKARVLPRHEGICPQGQIECPNVGCGETVARRSMAEHRGLCGREEVKCPCPGCEERMARVEVGEHVEASGALHLLRAWGRVAEMEDKVAGLQRRFDLLTRVFTWSTDSEWSSKMSLPHTFTDGVSGRCFYKKPEIGNNDHFMGFALHDGPTTCTMHYKCMIVGKDDKVLRVVSDPSWCDLTKPPTETAARGNGRGVLFTLTEEDKAGAVRADGSIKLRMVVHLYLPE